MPSPLEKCRDGARALERHAALAATPCRARGGLLHKAGPPPRERPPCESLPKGGSAGATSAGGSAAPPPQTCRPRLLQACGRLPFDLLLEDCFSPSSSGGSRGSAGSCEGAGPAPAAAVDERSRSFPAVDTLIIFDWDDTLMPTTWLKSQGLSVHSRQSDVEQRREELDRIAAAARGSLLAAKRLGHVAIVTNADRGWIEMSCGLFLPTLQAELEGIHIVSARSTYESWQHQQPHEWKALAFRDELRRAFGDDLASGAAAGWKANVLSLGDSLDERQALHTSTAELPGCRRKSLKFVDDPDPLQLCEQHRLVSSNLETIILQDCSLDLKILCE